MTEITPQAVLDTRWTDEHLEVDVELDMAKHLDEIYALEKAFVNDINGEMTVKTSSRGTTLDNVIVTDIQTEDSTYADEAESVRASLVAPRDGILNPEDNHHGVFVPSMSFELPEDRVRDAFETHADDEGGILDFPTLFKLLDAETAVHRQSIREAVGRLYERGELELRPAKGYTLATDETDDDPEPPDWYDPERHPPLDSDDWPQVFTVYAHGGDHEYRREMADHYADGNRQLDRALRGLGREIELTYLVYEDGTTKLTRAWENGNDELTRDDTQ